jgi:WD40 repeat protein/predicted Ser/Thr protein kinase
VQALPPEVEVLSTVQVPGYEVLDLLGKGGMGIVYKSRQIALQRVVALKMILNAEYAGEDERRRFRIEAEAIAALQHPHVVQVYEVGEYQGTPFFSLEFCGGGNLAERLDGTPWEAKPAAALVEKLARAVQAAHERGIVHRDLKPANVLLTEDDTPKVTDFGLAKRVGERGQTQTGAVLGTPSYMAPEQAGGKGRNVGPAVDIYALGALLYELLTGRPPFKAATPLDTLLQVVSEEPVPVRRLQAKVSRDLETICHKCLQKDPKKRYRTAGALAEDLHRFRAGLTVAARPVGVPGRLARWVRRRPAVTALLALVVLVATAGLAGILWAYGEAVHQRDRAREEARRADDAASQALLRSFEAERARQEARLQTYAAQVGRAYAWVQAGDPREAHKVLDQTAAELRGWEYGYLRRRAEGTALVVHNADGFLSEVRWSPDGTRLATASGAGTICLWEARTGSASRILRGLGGSVWCLAWSPDGKRLAAGGSGVEVLVWEARTGTLLARLPRPAPPSDQPLVGPPTAAPPARALAWSPDGSQLAAAAGDGLGYVWDLRAPGPARVLMDRRPATKQAANQPAAFGQARLQAGVCWSPDGNRLATTGGDGIKVWAMPAGVLVQTIGTGGGPPRSVCWSPDGTRLASASASAQALIWDAHTGALRLILRGHRGAVRAVCWSPDGTRLATTVEELPGGRTEDRTVRIWDAHTGAEALALHHVDPVTGFSWSPDGNRLATVSDRTLRVWNARMVDEALVLRKPSTASTLIQSLPWSQDGSRLAAFSNGDEAWSWDARTGTVVPPPRPGQRASLPILDRNSLLPFDQGGNSPTSRRATASASSTVRLSTAPGNTEILVLRGHTDHVHALSWSPDSTRLATAAVDGMTRVWDARSGPLAWLVPWETTGMASIFWSPDSKRLAGVLGSVVEVRDVRTQVGFTLRHAGPVLALCWSANGAFLATADQSPSMHVWDCETGTESRTLSEDTTGVRALAWSPDGTQLASGSADGKVMIWDVQSKAAPRILPGNLVMVTALTWSPDGSRLAGAALSNATWVWDTRTGVQTHTFRDGAAASAPGSTRPTSLRWSPDGRRLTLRRTNLGPQAWDIATGTPVPVAEAEASDDGLSPDDRFLAVKKENAWTLYPLVRSPQQVNLWEEDWQRRQALAAAWHAEDAAAAEKAGNVFAARLHRTHLAALHPDDWRNWQALAALEGSPARELCDRRLASDPGLAPMYLQRARLRHALGQGAAGSLDVLTALVLASNSRLGWPEFAAAAAEAGNEAAAAGDWVRARQHFGLAVLFQASEPDYLRRQALAELAAGDIEAYRRSCRRLVRDSGDVSDLAPLFHLSAAFADARPAGIFLASGIPVAEAALRQEKAHRAATAVRAAVVRPDSGVPPAELLDLCGRAENGWSDAAEEAMMHGVALYRAGDSRAALEELQRSQRLALEARRQLSPGWFGSVQRRDWPALVETLAGNQAGSADQTRRLWEQAPPAASWDEGVIRRQLLTEVAAMKP